MGDHTETLQVDYDPGLISYEELLEIFWENHNPFRQAMSKQYRNIIFVHSEEQERLAGESKALLAEKQKSTVKTDIAAFNKFYQAEDYHQKYYLQGVPGLLQEFNEFYPEFQDVVNSTAAARVNGYIAGYGDTTSLSRELKDLGLSPEGHEILKEFVK